MIEFNNIKKEDPFILFKEKYDAANAAGQELIEAVNIASFDRRKQEVNSRYVNLKIVENDQFIFFTNYNSPKSIEFIEHKQISATFYWRAINTQIRMKAHIKKTEVSFNKLYFSNRSLSKNALAISSNQSAIITSFEEVKKKYNMTLKNSNLTSCPDYWGGFSFSPFEIEFWEGSEFRLNKRNLYTKEKERWNHFILEP